MKSPPVKKTRRKHYHFRPFVICYAFIKDHTEARDIITFEELTQEGAERKFQQQNPHLLVVPSIKLSGDPWFLVNLRVILEENQIKKAV